jgi:hypothetical protein
MLPAGSCCHLQKLMLSGNRLATLPQSLSMCSSLELVRLGANNIVSFPRSIIQLPRLAWLCFSGNPITAAAETRALGAMPQSCTWQQLEIHERLGEGASGIAYRAVIRGRGVEINDPVVAVKVFKTCSVTSDGLPSSEVAAWIRAGRHSNIIPVLHNVVEAPGGVQALVMPLVDSAFFSLAAAPSLETCTRDVLVGHHHMHCLKSIQQSTGTGSEQG